LAKRLKGKLLKKYTTFNIGGPAEIFSIPNDVEDLISEIAFCQKNGIPYRVLGNGSNILVSDKGIKGFIIKLNKAFNTLKLINENRLEVGSGVLLQKFINFSIDNDLGGNEKLFSIPGTIGGAIYMNAGLGRNDELSISDYLKTVKVFDGKETREIEKQACNFCHRSSIFQQNKDWVILSAVFELYPQDKFIGQRKKDERMKLVKGNQDRKYPSAGSIFKKN